MERCPVCQGVLDPETRRCQQCGYTAPTSLPATSAAQQAETRPCPNCGSLLPPQARFCSACGQSLRSTLPKDIVNPQPSAKPIRSDAPAAPAGVAEPSSKPQLQQSVASLQEKSSLPDSSLPPSSIPREWTSEKGIKYLDFELQIGPRNGNTYQVSVLHSPAGEAHDHFQLPFRKEALVEQLYALQTAVIPPTNSARQPITARQQTIQHFGQALFDALMVREIRSLYDTSRQLASVRGKGLRLKLHIQAPELASIPWEYLYDARQGSYLSLSRYTSVVRYLDLQQPIQRLTAHFPLRILVMLVSPTDRDPLDLEGEKRRLHAALDELEVAGLVQVTWLEGKSLDNLREAMHGGPWHVFHFVGHGGFAAESGEGVIALADQDGRTQVVSAMQLATLLSDHKSLRLVVLNSCEGARGNDQDLFSSTASTLALRGIPAILAMQYKISDTAAIELARVFYQSLANGLPVDDALAEARKAISVGKSGTLQWGTPVLYLRSPNGVLFNFQPLPPDYWLKLGERLFKEQRLEEALQVYERAIRSGRTAALAYLGKAETLKRLKRFEAALIAYDHALQLDAHLPQAYLGKAEVLYSMGEKKEALSVEVRGLREQTLQKRLWLFVRGSKVWMRGVTGLSSLLLFNIVSVVLGFSPLPTSSPLINVIRLHPIASMLLGGISVAATVAALLFSRDPASQALATHVDRPLARRLFISNSVATGSTTLFIGLLAAVLIRPPWCPTALCPAAKVILVTNPHGIHDANLEMYFTAFQSTYYEIPGDPTHYSLSNPPESIGALRIDEQTPPPYRVVLGIHSLQQGRFGILIQQVALVIEAVPAMPASLQVWDAGAPLTYQSNPFQVSYHGEQVGDILPAAYVPLPGGHVQLAPGESDELDIQVDSRVVVDLKFRVQITYRVFNETPFHTLTLPKLFEVVFSSSGNWNLFQFQGGQLVPNPTPTATP